MENVANVANVASVNFQFSIGNWILGTGNNGNTGNIQKPPLVAKRGGI